MVLLTDPSEPLDGLIAKLTAALAGTGPALLPVTDDEHGRRVVAAAHLDEPIAEDTALLLPTSGSTGAPKVVELSAQALLSSARATHDRVGPPGRWLLNLPLTHVAGWQVLVRGLLAEPAQPPVHASGPFVATGYLRTLRQHPDVRYVSLVPTQLRRLLDDPSLDLRPAQNVTVLLGGAAAGPTCSPPHASADCRSPRPTARPRPRAGVCTTAGRWPVCAPRSPHPPARQVGSP